MTTGEQGLPRAPLLSSVWPDWPVGPVGGDLLLWTE
jgi:hypothetical protein